MAPGQAADEHLASSAGTPHPPRCPPGVPGVIFKLLALVREELATCESVPLPTLREGSFPEMTAERLLCCMAPRRLPPRECEAGSRVAVAALLRRAAAQAAPLAAAPVRAGQSMIARVVDPAQGDEGMAVAWGVSQELDDLKHLYYGLPDLLGKVRRRRRRGSRTAGSAGGWHRPLPRSMCSPRGSACQQESWQRCFRLGSAGSLLAPRPIPPPGSRPWSRSSGACRARCRPWCNRTSGPSSTSHRPA